MNDTVKNSEEPCHGSRRRGTILSFDAINFGSHPYYGPGFRAPEHAMFSAVLNDAYLPFGGGGITTAIHSPHMLVTSHKSVLPINLAFFNQPSSNVR